MIELQEDARLTAASNGDEEAFRTLTDPYRHELLVHCYRMLGSFEDAEDTLQETLIRAWRKLASFEGRSSLRAWLYKIATNASLDALRGRRMRALPSLSYPPAQPHFPLPEPVRDTFWIEPLPDILVDQRPFANPETRYEAHESITFAFLVALQNLPGRQRAVLLLRDVLGWNTAETAEILNMTEVAVNSALQRARTTMKQHQGDPQRNRATPATDEQIATLLTRYVESWEAADSATLVELLREDAVLTMPPLPVWYSGRDAIQWFLDSHLFTGKPQKRFRLVVTRANGCPAFAVYQLDDSGVYQASALHVLTIEQNQISAIHDFLILDESDGRLFSRFGLPLLQLTDEFGA